MNTPADLASKCAAECAKAASDFVMMREYDYAGYDREAATIEFAKIILSHFGPELTVKEQELERLRKALEAIKHVSIGAHSIRAISLHQCHDLAKAALETHDQANP